MQREAAPLRPWHGQAFASVPVTATLLASFVIIFILEEVWGGSTSTLTLARMGAIVGGVEVSHPYARLLSYGALHIGLTHVAVNSFSFWNLGLALEPLLGRGLYATLFFGSVLAGGLGIATFAGTGITAGASGGLFGLLGAVTVLLVIRYRSTNHPYEKAEIRNQLMMLILPNALISMLPGISLSGHAAGFVFGLLFVAGLRMMQTSIRDRESARRLERTANITGTFLAFAFASSLLLVWSTSQPWISITPG